MNDDNPDITGYQVLTAADEHGLSDLRAIDGVFRDKASRTYPASHWGPIDGRRFTSIAGATKSKPRHRRRALRSTRRGSTGSLPDGGPIQD